jgi:hypothetical protein
MKHAPFFLIITLISSCAGRQQMMSHDSWIFDLAKDASWSEGRKLYVSNTSGSRPMMVDGEMVKYPIGDFVGTVQYAVAKTIEQGDILLSKKTIPYKGRTVWCINVRLASDFYSMLIKGIKLEEIEGDLIVPPMNAFIDDRERYHVEIIGDRAKYFVFGKYLSASVSLVDPIEGGGIGVNLKFEGTGVQNGVDGSIHTTGPVSFTILSDSLSDGVYVLPGESEDTGRIYGYFKSDNGLEFWYSE